MQPVLLLWKRTRNPKPIIYHSNRVMHTPRRTYSSTLMPSAGITIVNNHFCTYFSNVPWIKLFRLCIFLVAGCIKYFVLVTLWYYWGNAFDCNLFCRYVIFAHILVLNSHLDASKHWVNTSIKSKPTIYSLYHIIICINREREKNRK